MSLLGLDIGTTRCKLILLDEEGQTLGLESREYPLEAPRPGRMELNPSIVWNHVLDCIRALSQRWSSDPPRALAISAQGEALIPVTSDGQTLTNAILTFDSRSTEQVEILRGHPGEEAFFSITGVNLHPMITVSKIRWLQEVLPELYEQAHRFLCFPDYVALQLGLTPTMDRSMAARTGGYDIHNKAWSDEIFQALNLDIAQVAFVEESGTSIGRLGSRGSDETGLPKGIDIILGGHDQCCAALGAGVIRSGQGLYTLGTVEGILVVVDEFKQGLGRSGFPCYPHVLSDRYVTLGFNFTGGSLLRWYRGQFFSEMKDQVEDVYKYMLNEMQPGPSRLLVLPYFTMSGTPYFETQPMGAVLRLDLTTRRSEFTKALLEGLSFETAFYMDAMDRAGVRPNLLRAVGGGAQSRALTVRADVLGCEIEVPRNTEGAAFGAAMIAGAAIGCFSDLEEAVEARTSLAERIGFNEERHTYYKDRLSRYKKLYPVLKQFYA